MMPSTSPYRLWIMTPKYDGRDAICGTISTLVDEYPTLDIAEEMREYLSFLDEEMSIKIVDANGLEVVGNREVDYSLDIPF